METLKKISTLVLTAFLLFSCELVEENFFPDHVSEATMTTGLGSYQTGTETDFAIECVETADGTIILMNYIRLHEETLIVLDSSFSVLSEMEIDDGRLDMETASTTISGDIIAGGVYLWQNDYTEANGFSAPTGSDSSMFFFNDGIYNYWVKCESDETYTSALVFYRVSDAAYTDMETLPDNRQISEDDRKLTLLNIYHDTANSQVVFVFEDSNHYYICYISRASFASDSSPIIESSNYAMIDRSHGSWKAWTSRGIVLEKTEIGSTSYVIFDLTGNEVDVKSKRVYENCQISFDENGNYMYFYDTKLKRMGKVQCWW